GRVSPGREGGQLPHLTNPGRTTSSQPAWQRTTNSRAKTARPRRGWPERAAQENASAPKHRRITLPQAGAPSNDCNGQAAGFRRGNSGYDPFLISENCLVG